MQNAMSDTTSASAGMTMYSAAPPMLYVDAECNRSTWIGARLASSVGTSTRATRSVCSLPPCGGGLVRGVAVIARAASANDHPHGLPLRFASKCYGEGKIGHYEVAPITPSTR